MSEYKDITSNSGLISFGNTGARLGDPRATYVKILEALNEFRIKNKNWETSDQEVFGTLLGEKNWVFNYEAVKQFNPNKTKAGEDKQMRDFLDFIELPIVQGKERIRGENGRALHPTQKPERLLELIIKASSNEQDIVLDPFFGTGTTGAVAQKLNRKWIGIESNSDYIKIAESRLKTTEYA